MTVAVVCPVVQPPEDVPGWEGWDRRRIIVIDNTTLSLWADLCRQKDWIHVSFHRNLGVATSWNLGIRWALQGGADAVALISSSVRWVKGLSHFTDGDWEKYGDPKRGLLTDASFHASIWARPVFERIGLFDENFWPAYFEDTDWLRRLEICGLHTPPEREHVRWPAADGGLRLPLLPKVELPGLCENAQSLRAGAVNVDFARQERYYTMKWGGLKHQETYDRPFGLHVPLAYWPVLREV